MPKVGQITWEQHQAKWLNCQRCELAKTRKKVVLCRGSLSADLLFVGEAPGTAEDVFGVPFYGPAGKLLDSLIKRAEIDPRFTFAMTNLVGCIPKADDGNKSGEPPDFAIKACAPRLVEIVKIAQPQVIIRVGKLAKNHIAGQAMFSDSQDIRNNGFGSVPWVDSIQFFDIDHPAWILRLDHATRPIAEKRAIVTIREAFSSVVPF